MPEGAESWTNTARDRAGEVAVLLTVIEAHPAQLTMPELIRKLGGGEPEFADRDGIERAVRELTGAGLLRRGGAETVLPTQAALRFNELVDE